MTASAAPPPRRPALHPALQHDRYRDQHGRNRADGDELNGARDHFPAEDLEHEEQITADGDSRADRGPAGADDDGFDGFDDDDFERELEDLHDEQQRQRSGGRAAALRFWLRWGIPIAALVVLAAALLTPGAFGVLAAKVHAIVPGSTSEPMNASAPAAPPPPTAESASAASPPQAAPDGASSAAPPAEQTAAPAPSDQAPPLATAPESQQDQATPPADVLAGPVDDTVLQQLLTRSMPERLSASDPDAAASAAAQRAREMAWTALAADLEAGGWSQPHLQAQELISDTAPPAAGALPDEVAVVLMWSATNTSGELEDRQLSMVRMRATDDGSWNVQAITTR